MSKLQVEETVTRTYRATERLYQNRDKSALVAEDDPEASFLFAAPGAEVSEEDARKYGLLEGEGGDATSAEASDAEGAASDEGRTEVVRDEVPAREISVPPKTKAAAKKSSKKSAK